MPEVGANDPRGDGGVVAVREGVVGAEDAVRIGKGGGANLVAPVRVLALVHGGVVAAAFHGGIAFVIVEGVAADALIFGIAVYTLMAFVFNEGNTKGDGIWFMVLYTFVFLLIHSVLTFFIYKINAIA